MQSVFLAYDVVTAACTSVPYSSRSLKISVPACSMAAAPVGKEPTHAVDAGVHEGRYDELADAEELW